MHLSLNIRLQLSIYNGNRVKLRNTQHSFKQSRVSRSPLPARNRNGGVHVRNVQKIKTRKLTSYLSPASLSQVSTFRQYGERDGTTGVRENWYKYTMSFSKFVLRTTGLGGCGSGAGTAGCSDASLVSVLVSGMDSWTSLVSAATLFSSLAIILSVRFL